jgi:hypothetical protein
MSEIAPQFDRLVAPAERRQFPRVKVMSMLHGYWVELDLPVTIRELSLGGFSVESAIPFPVGFDHTFLFSAADGRETLIRSCCRHSRMEETDRGTTCVAGFEFLPQPEEQLKIVVETVRQLGGKYPG